MKVTVCFDAVKVIVPCGDGDLAIKDLIERATARFIKASQKDNVSSIDVKYLQTEDNAILDHDDIIADVCDDKDKLIAVFEDKSQAYSESDGYILSETTHVRASSNSSSLSGLTSYHMERDQPVALPPDFDNEKSQSSYFVNKENIINEGRQTERRNWRDWRKEQQQRPGDTARNSKPQSIYSSSASSTPVSSPDASKDTLGFGGFDRNANRKSLSVGHPLLYSWIDAQEKMNQHSQVPDEEKAYGKPHAITKRLSAGHDGSSATSGGDFDDFDDISSTSSEEVELEARLREDFGLRVQGYKNADGKELGLIVHEIKNDSIMGKNGSLNIADRITEVNGVNLRDKSNAEAETILNEALEGGFLRLKRTRSHHFIRASLREVSSEKMMNLPRVPEAAIINSREAPKVKMPLADVDPHEAPIEDPKNEVPVQNVLVGKRIVIELRKGASGLGFSITSRDVITKDKNPVYVKNILPKGAAIQDGRLKVGDQIIEINGIDVSNKDQNEIVNILKKATGLVRLIVNRQQSQDIADVDENEDAMETISNDSGIATVKDEILSMVIPLNDLGSAGLGISVKGKSMSQEKCDLGIFVKSVIKGGAASKDGRLKPEDRLLQINDIYLDGMSNEKAMEAMRNALSESLKKGSIKIVVSRKAKTEIAVSVPDRRPEIAVPSLKRPDIDTTKIPNGLEQISRTRDKSYVQTQQAVSVYQGLDNNQGSIKVAEVKEINGSVSKPLKAKSSLEGPGKFVSVSSSEIPAHHPSKTVIVERSPTTDVKQRQLVEIKSTVFPNEKEFFFQNKSSTPLNAHQPEESYRPDTTESVLNPPSYQETLKRRSTSSSDTGSNIGSYKPSQMQARPRGFSNNELDDMDLIRTMSTSSRFSIDSLVVSPGAMPFERDAFGRLSMSERKGRAHLDATKSDFYSKLKKSKSLENVHSIKPINSISLAKYDQNDTGIVPLHQAVRRSESLDTVLSSSHPTPDDEEAFHRNSALSKSTPWHAQRSISPKAAKLRSRSTAWNDSFRIAVDQTQVFYTQDSKRLEQEGTVPLKLTSNANYSESQQGRKKSGILKGLGNLLKKGKSRKADAKNETKELEQARGDVEKLIDFARSKRPRSLHEDNMAQRQGIVNDAFREREHAKREKEEKLVMIQRQLHSTKREEVKLNGNATEKTDGRTNENGIARKQNYNIALEPSQSNRQLVQNQTGIKQEGHKSLLQRGQERMRDRKHDSSQQKSYEAKEDQKPEEYSAVLPNMQGNARSELRESQRRVIADPRSELRESQRRVIADSRSELRESQRKMNIDHRSELREAQRLKDTNQMSKVIRNTSNVTKPTPGSGQESEVRVNSQYGRNVMPANRTERVPPFLDSREGEDDQGSKKRLLPQTPLFYYGHSSLPRKFTLNNVRKKSASESNKPNLTIEEQTEAFNRAQHNYDEFQARSSKRAAAVQRRNPAPASLDSNVGNITISHAANI